MTTENHDLIYPTEGNYVEAFQRIADQVDEKLIFAGEIEERPDPTDGRMFVDIDGNSNPDADGVLYAARNGGWEVVDLEISTDLSTVPKTDDPFVITAIWGGLQDWDADIDGSAQYAESVDHAESASHADTIDGVNPDIFADATVEIIVSEQWEYQEEQVFEDGIDADVVFGFPSYGDT